MTDRPRSFVDWMPFLWSRVLFPSTQSAPTDIRLPSLLLLVALPAVLLYPTLSFHLLEPDEGRYAQIPREMLARGDWVVPHLQSQPYLDKPPLLYWLVMLSYSAFGVSEAPARLIPALAVHGTILVVYLLGRRSLGERSAFWGALFLTVAPGFVGMARVLTLDGLLTFWITLALFATFEAIRGDRFRVGWWYVAALAAGLGVLTKGPIPLLLLVPPIWLHRRLTGHQVPIEEHTCSVSSASSRPSICRGTWRIFLREPVFLRYFFWEHNVLRFVQPFDHLQPVWYYLPIVLGGLLPGSVLLYAFARHLLSGDPDRTATRTPALGFWLIAGLWCVFFFSMSGCKLPTYVLPAFPCLCLALGRFRGSHALERATHHPLGHRRRWRRCWCSASTSRCRGTRNAARRWAIRTSRPGSTPSAREPMYCFPRNVDSVAFYTDRDDLKSCRTKISQELVEALILRDRSVVLFTHRHSLDTFKQVLPPMLKVTEVIAVRYPGTGAHLLDKLVGDGPWGLCHIAVIERVPYPPPKVQ